jgi:hypothetical protein
MKHAIHTREFPLAAAPSPVVVALRVLEAQAP